MIMVKIDFEVFGYFWKTNIKKSDFQDNIDWVFLNLFLKTNIF